MPRRVPVPVRVGGVESCGGGRRSVGDVDERTANLLGAFSLLVAGDIRAATGDAVGSGGASASALVLVASMGNPSIDQLARSLGLSHSGTVRLVDRLQAEGLLERQPGLDARSVALRLTRTGRRAVERIRAARQQVLAARLGVLDEADRARLAELLEKLLVGAVEAGATEWHVCQLCDVASCSEPYCPVERTARAIAAG